MAVSRWRACEYEILSHMLWYRDCHRVDATGIDAFDVVKLCSSLRLFATPSARARRRGLLLTASELYC